MARHSFIQMSKLSNVKGRISYITSHAKQENLYATYRTADNEFWSRVEQNSDFLMRLYNKWCHPDCLESIYCDSTLQNSRFAQP